MGFFGKLGLIISVPATPAIAHVPDLLLVKHQGLKSRHCPVITANASYKG